jgi:hypothetical protein
LIKQQWMRARAIFDEFLVIIIIIIIRSIT